MGDFGRHFPDDYTTDDYTTAELHAIATRALATGDDYARALLREQLEREEIGERSDLAHDQRQLET
jgi:hypothetical protein